MVTLGGWEFMKNRHGSSRYCWLALGAQEFWVHRPFNTLQSASLFPDRQSLVVSIRDATLQGGAWHCRVV